MKLDQSIFKAYDISGTKPFNRQIWLKVAANEASNLEKVLPLLKNEKEIGFHSEARDWFFTEESVKENLKHLKAKIAASHPRGGL